MGNWSSPASAVLELLGAVNAPGVGPKKDSVYTEYCEGTDLTSRP